MSVTAITFAVNPTSAIVNIVNYENPNHSGNNVSLTPNTSMGTPQCNMWLPYCDTAEQFSKGKYIHVKIKSGNTDYYLWQQGDYVRFNNKKEWIKDGPKVPGTSEIIGNRTVTFSENGGLTFSKNS